MVALVGTTFGGMAFAAERRERTADFLNLLPPSRGASALSKLLVAVLALAAAFAMHIWLMSVGARAYDIPNGYNFTFSWDLQDALLWGAGLVMAFGVAWLLSSFLSSSAISACIGGGCSLLAFIAMQYVAEGRLWREPRIEAWWAAIAVSCGLAGLVAGTVIYLRRVEP